jgi:squalene synthase HpnC
VTASVETPSGKGAKDENFPVGSWLLPARLRPHVAAFYAFARAGDDIADNPKLAPEDKITRLNGFAAALEHGEGHPKLYGKALRLRESLAQTGVPARHGLDLLEAFKQDAVKNRYASWDDLIGYCRLSAAPVGRFLLDLHGENRDGWPASDALCNALQIVNHLQDCQGDHRSLNRVYLPLDWLACQAGRVEDLQAKKANSSIRAVLDMCLTGTEELLATAAELPPRLRSRSLAMESAVILHLARRLTRRLRDGDPIAGRVKLTRWDFARCGVSGVAVGLISAGRLAAKGAP